MVSLHCTPGGSAVVVRAVLDAGSRERSELPEEPLVAAVPWALPKKLDRASVPLPESTPEPLTCQDGGR